MFLDKKYKRKDYYYYYYYFFFFFPSKTSNGRKKKEKKTVISYKMGSRKHIRRQHLKQKEKRKKKRNQVRALRTPSYMSTKKKKTRNYIWFPTINKLKDKIKKKKKKKKKQPYASRCNRYQTSEAFLKQLHHFQPNERFCCFAC